MAQVRPGRVIELTCVPQASDGSQTILEHLREGQSDVGSPLNGQPVQRSVRQREQHRDLKVEWLRLHLRLGQHGADSAPMLDELARSIIGDAPEAREHLELQKLRVGESQRLGQDAHRWCLCLAADPRHAQAHVDRGLADPR